MSIFFSNFFQKYYWWVTICYMIIYQLSIFNNKILAKEKPPNFKKPQFLPNRGLTTWLWASQFLTNCKSYDLNPSWLTLCLYIPWLTGGVFHPPPGNDTSARCRMLIYDRWAYRMNMRWHAHFWPPKVSGGPLGGLKAPK